MADEGQAGTGKESKHQEVRKKLEDWGDWIMKCIVGKSICAIVLIVAISATISAIVTWIKSSSISTSVLIVAIITSLCIVVLACILFGLIIWGIIKICELD